MQEKKVWVIGVLCGVGCALCVSAYLINVRGQVETVRAEALERYGGDQVEVCVATRDLLAGETISASDIEEKLWVAALLPKGAMRDRNQVVGSRVSSTVLSGEVVSERRLGGEEELLEVPDGLTAVSVPAKSVQAVGGALAPGQKVDLYSTGNTSTQQIGSELLVLATSTSSDVKTNAEMTWITLAVSPQSVQEIVVAAQSATLYFTLPGEGVSSSPALSTNVQGSFGGAPNGMGGSASAGTQSQRE